MTAPKTGSNPRLRLRVTNVAESILRRGHPWLFADSVVEQNRPGSAGELGVVFDKKDRFLAVGFYDPDSPIRLRVLHAGNPVTIDAAWRKTRWDEALARRDGLFDNSTDGYRCINGESDGWPGLVMDRYAKTFVLKIYSAAWFPYLGEIADLFQGSFPGCGLVLRLSRNLRDAAAKPGGCSEGQWLAGPGPVEPVVFRETGLWFEADVLRGQKTGFFLDQRENRRRVEARARGRSVLNVFSYTGGFSLYAARGGAARVDSLDLSAHALDGARRNFALNQADPNVAACGHRTIQADAFEWLGREEPARYDLVIIDPPSLAMQESAHGAALSGYASLIRQGIRRLNPAGILVAASCSSHIPAAEFLELVRQAARASGRGFEQLEVTAHAPDHPATFKEAEYLKCAYLAFD